MMATPGCFVRPLWRSCSGLYQVKAPRGVASRSRSALAIHPRCQTSLQISRASPGGLFLGRGHSTKSNAPDHSPSSFPALFVRGGTSNGLVIRRDDLPAEHEWPAVLAAAMGSPDPYGRQLNGMGSGISSTSKIVVLGEPSRPDVDVDFTFVQVGIKDGALDMAGNCGNMSSIVGPAAWDLGMLMNPRSEYGDQGEEHGVVRFLNTNTSKVVESRFKLKGHQPRFDPEGDYVLDGVARTGSEIRMSFLDPAGAKTGKAVPTGNPVDMLELPDGRHIPASLVDVANPGVFVRADSLGLGSRSLPITPQSIEADASLQALLESIRQAGATRMGLDPNVQSVPKIVLISPPDATEQIDIRCVAMSMGQAHKAVPLTLAMCLGAACQMQGTIAGDIMGDKPKATVTIGHPTGRLDVGTTTAEDGKIISADLLRTARVLMEGRVFF